MLWNWKGEMLQLVSITVDLGMTEVEDAALDIKKYAWITAIDSDARQSIRKISPRYLIFQVILVVIFIHSMTAKTHQSQKPISIEAEVRLWKLSIPTEDDQLAKTLYVLSILKMFWSSFNSAYKHPCLNLLITPRSSIYASVHLICEVGRPSEMSWRCGSHELLEYQYINSYYMSSRPSGGLVSDCLRYTSEGKCIYYKLRIDKSSLSSNYLTLALFYKTYAFSQWHKHTYNKTGAYCKSAESTW